MIKVSIIVPVYNVEKYLERCLDSILNQTLDDIEVICINDGSTDSSSLILEQYKNKDNRIKIIDKLHEGVSIARNIGINVAQGEYISFIDSDDFIEKNYYETLYNTALNYCADVVCTNITRENEKKSAKLINYIKEETSNNIKAHFLLAKSPQYNFACNKIYKKEFIKSNNICFIEGLIYEDMCFTSDVLEKCSCLVATPNTMYHYWKNKNSLIKRCDDKSRADKLFAHKYLYDKCKTYNIEINQTNELQFKEDYICFGIPILRKIIYRATVKYKLFNFIPFLEIRRKI